MAIINKDSIRLIIITPDFGYIPIMSDSPANSSRNGTDIANIFMIECGNREYPYITFANSAGFPILCSDE